MRRVVRRHKKLGGEGRRREAGDQQSGNHVFLHHEVSWGGGQPSLKVSSSKKPDPMLPFGHAFFASRKSVAAGVDAARFPSQRAHACDWRSYNNVLIKLESWCGRAGLILGN